MCVNFNAEALNIVNGQKNLSMVYISETFCSKPKPNKLLEHATRNGVVLIDTDEKRSD